MCLRLCEWIWFLSQFRDKLSGSYYKAVCNYSLRPLNTVQGQPKHTCPGAIISLHLPYIYNIKYIIFYYFTIVP